MNKHLLSEIDVIARTAVCAHCGPVRVHSSGMGGRSVRCGEYIKEYRTRPGKRAIEVARAMEKIYENRAYVQGLKTENPCVDCARYYPYYVMDHDHARGKKFKAIPEMMSYSRKRLDEELAKCDLLCSNCHRIRTHERGYPNSNAEKVYKTVNFMA